MAVRIYETGNPPRLITSKPGYNASPSLRDDLKTFDSNWFNGCGVKFKYFGPYAQNYTFNYPYALGFVPRFMISQHMVWNGDANYFYWRHPNSPGFTVNPPNEAMILIWQASAAGAVAYSNRVEFTSIGPVLSNWRMSLLVLEA